MLCNPDIDACKDGMKGKARGCMYYIKVTPLLAGLTQEHDINAFNENDDEFAIEGN